jgi:hypothetical protein
MGDNAKQNRRKRKGEVNLIRKTLKQIQKSVQIRAKKGACEVNFGWGKYHFQRRKMEIWFSYRYYENGMLLFLASKEQSQRILNFISSSVKFNK